MNHPSLFKQGGDPIHQAYLKKLPPYLLLVIIVIVAIYFGWNPAPKQKGTWIWDTSTIVTDRENILTFSEENDVTEIYLYIDQKMDPQDYARFIQEAGKHEIRVEALGGDPSWGLKDKLNYAQEFIDWVESYNLQAQEEERFSGIHLDIEPYLLPGWEKDQNSILEEWLSNMESLAETDLKVSVDLPFWSNQIKIPGSEGDSLSAWMLKRFDTVVLMNYRDTAEGDDGIIANALEIVKEASALEKSVVVGVEMAPTSEGDKTTFYEEGVGEMEKELEMARDQLKRNEGFQGMAIHGFPDWMSSYQKEKGGKR